MNKNSIKAYNEITEDGTLAKMEREVLHIIRIYGPINGRMIDDRIDGGHKRIKCLLEMGVIAVAFNDIDSITGKTTAFYHATGNKPKPIATKKKNKVIMPQELSAFYDDAFKSGIRAAITTAMSWMGEKQTAEELEHTVNLIAGVQK